MSLQKDLRDRKSSSFRVMVNAKIIERDRLIENPATLTYLVAMSGHSARESRAITNISATCCQIMQIHGP